jgi:hypothetical protein
VLGATLASAAALYGALVFRARFRGRLADSGYVSPLDADVELDALAAEHPGRARVETYGSSSQGRPLRLLRIGRAGARARVLVTGQIHAGEFIGGVVARGIARSLLASRSVEVQKLLGKSEIVIAPLLNPDGAQRVWDANGWTGFRGMRGTASGADPNRNFPFALEADGSARARSWNSARSAEGHPYFRGAAPLSEPECAALAQLAERERFCGALNFHSFGGIVYLPMLSGAFDAGEDAAASGLRAIADVYPAKQLHLAYRVVPEDPEAIDGQLDAFLLGAFGTPSATIEIGRPSLGFLKPSRFLNPFWVFNPERPGRWLENDVEAAIQTIAALVEVTKGEPGTPRQPGLAAHVSRPS